MSNVELVTLPGTTSVEDVVAVLRRDGGVIIADFLDSHTLSALSADLMPKLNRTAPGAEDGFAGTRTRRLGALFAHSRYMQDIVLHPLFLGAANALINEPVEAWVGDERVSVEPGIRIGATQAIQIWPDQKAQPLHRDDLVFGWRHPEYGREARVQIMIAVTDFNAVNGATLVVPGSHKWDDQRKPTREEAIPATMEAGSALIWVGSLFHAGGANMSTLPRTGISVGLDAANLRQEENMYLSLPRDVVATYPETIQRLLGWTAGDNFMGWVEIDGQMADPNILLQDNVIARLSAVR